jgi:signal transduction histidine kinase
LRSRKVSLTDREGRWWGLRVRPYLTADSRIDGATLVAFDINSVKRNRELSESRDSAHAIVQTVREPIVVLDSECRVELANARTITRDARSPLLLLSVDDVTDARQAERLRIDAETLRLLDRRKDEFLGILAHELRNPSRRCGSRWS